MKRLCTIFCYVGLILIAGTPQSFASETKEPIKVAFAAELTGAFADFSMPCVSALQIAVDEINQKGGVLGRPLELIVVDTKGKPDVGVSTARELIVNQKITVLAGACSGAVTLAMAEVAEQYKIPQLAFPTGTNVVAPRFNKYLFMVSQTADLCGFALGEYLASKPFKTYYTIGLDYIYGHQLVEYTWSRLKERKPQVVKVGEAWPKIATEDYTPYITAILAKKPDAVIAGMAGIDDTNFMKQAKGFGYFDQVQHATVIGLSYNNRVPAGKSFPENVIGGSHYDERYYEGKYPAYKSFNEKFDRKAGDYKYFYGTSHVAYDTMYLLVGAIKKAGSTQADKLVEALENSQVDGTRGKIEMLGKTHRLANPWLVGVSTYEKGFPYAVLKDIKEYRGLKYMLSDQAIMEGWHKAK
jgi:branched-chain amino acid transport system substrate-binding protein